MAKKPDPPIPQKTPAVEINGSVKFFCCGEVHEAKGELVKVVLCPICRTQFGFLLYPRPLGDEVWAHGTELRTTREVETVAGCKNVKIEKGKVVRVGADPHGVLGTNEEETLVEYESRARSQFGGGMRILYAPIPNDALEPLETP